MVAFSESYSVMPGGVPRLRGGYAGSDFDVQGPGAELLLEMAARRGGPTPADVNPSWLESLQRKTSGLGRRARMAVDKPLEAIGLAKNGKLLAGRAAGLGTILTLLSAAEQLNNPNGEPGENIARAGGQVAGGLGGGAAGAAIGGALTLGNPAGVIAGATIGNMLGSNVGTGLTDFVMRLAQGSPEDRALAQYRKQQQAVTQAEVDKLNALLPIQERAAALQLQNRGRQLEQDGEQRLNDAVVAAMLRQQDNNRMLAAQLTEGILGGGGLV